MPRRFYEPVYFWIRTFPANLHPVYERIRRIRYQKGKLNVIKREKIYIVLRSVGFDDWFVEFKRYLNSRQIRSKNKLVQENTVTRAHRKLLAPGYGLLVINDVIMTSLLLLQVINVLANSLILSDALLYILSI